LRAAALRLVGQKYLTPRLQFLEKRRLLEDAVYRRIRSPVHEAVDTIAAPEWWTVPYRRIFTVTFRFRTMVGWTFPQYHPFSFIDGQTLSAYGHNRCYESDGNLKAGRQHSAVMPPLLYLYENKTKLEVLPLLNDTTVGAICGCCMNVQRPSINSGSTV
jgi:hypothetical protein